MTVSHAIPSSDAGLLGSIRPIKYRYVMADIRTGQMISTLPMTGVTYNIGRWAGTEMSGSVYLPDMLLDQMSHPPGYEFERWRHPDRGLPLGSMFEVGNRALYVMRNDEVVWGGILWSRAYSSGDRTMSITGMSWEAYIYYRAFRHSVIFLDKTTPKYVIWRAVLMHLLASKPDESDFNWKGENGAGKNAGSTTDYGVTSWTGKQANSVSNVPLTPYEETWPHSSPPIEIPPAGLQFKDPAFNADTDFQTSENRWRGYEMSMVGEQLQTWADATTLVTGGGVEYRVLCWWDEAQQKFRQRYTFGEMEYDDGTISGTPTSILSPVFGRPVEEAEETILDFPGHIAEWSLAESMEEAATRVIVTGDTGSEAYTKIAVFPSHKDLLQPGGVGDGSDGWLLYDKVVAYSSSSYADITSRGQTLLKLYRPPQAASIDDLADVSTGPRTSQRATDLTITLYQDPTTTFPPWRLGDWVTFAIEDPFYGGRMYLKRRIIGYTVTVVPDHESDYSHESITLELTDDTKVAPGEGGGGGGEEGAEA